jgi:hypothetical protein
LSQQAQLSAEVTEKEVALMKRWLLVLTAVAIITALMATPAYAQLAGGWCLDELSGEWVDCPDVNLNYFG